MNQTRDLCLVISDEVVAASQKMSEEIRSQQPKNVPNLTDFVQMKAERDGLVERATFFETRASNADIAIAQLQETIGAAKKTVKDIQKELSGSVIIPGAQAKLQDLNHRIEAMESDLADWKREHERASGIATSTRELIKKMESSPDFVRLKREERLDRELDRKLHAF